MFRCHHDVIRELTAGRLRTAEWRKNVARHCAFLVLWGIFFVILPSSVFLPSCCVRSLISNQIRFWFLISGEGPNIRCTWLDFVDLDARITWPCLRIRLTWSQFLWLGFCTIWLSKSLGQRSAHSTQYSWYQWSDVTWPLSAGLRTVPTV